MYLGGDDDRSRHNHDYLLRPAARDRARRSGSLRPDRSILETLENPMSPSLPARGLLGLIQLYKWMLSPIVGRDCRYLPTCSSYAADAVRQHGAWVGTWMATARICRCHPWGGDGWDPAPETLPRAPWWAPWRLGDWKRGHRAPPNNTESIKKVP